MGPRLYFGGRSDEADFGNPYAMAQYGQPGPVVWGQQGPQWAPQPQWGQPGLAFYGAEQDVEILGAYEILGSPTASPMAKQAANALLAAKQVGGAAVLQKIPRREYQQTLPCTSLAVLTTATRDISLNPQRPFRPEKFRASSTHTAPFFVISAYSIGQDNQFVGPGTIPVDLFSEVALYSQIEAYTANLGNLITLTVQNIDADTRDFRAAFFGTSLGN